MLSNPRLQLPVSIWACALIGLAMLQPPRIAAQDRLPPIHAEERQLAVRPASHLAPAGLRPQTVTPQTVAPADLGRRGVNLSLDDAIRIALGNSEVVRVLVNGTPTAAGGTIYDPAIRATDIDQARAGFDLTFESSNMFDQLDVPLGIYDLTTPELASIRANKIQNYRHRTGFSKKTITGGVAALNVTASNTDRGPFGLTLAPLPPLPNPLNPENRTGVEFSFVQPLLQGAGAKANAAPIVVAQINTEISYYDLKVDMENLVRSVIEAYWGLVFARVDVWVRQEQVEESAFAYERAKSRQAQGTADAAEVAQTRAALARFRVALISAKAEALNREATMRNVLGVPAADAAQLIPVTAMRTDDTVIDWDLLASSAIDQRSDIAQLKLSVEAAEQSLLLAKNMNHPRVDVVGNYRMNGLSGTSPSGAGLSSTGGQFTGWTLGVNISAPLGQRAMRADLRRQELTIARNRAALNQAIHSALHQLAQSYRNVRQFYQEFLALKEAREAERINLEQQLSEYGRGRAIYLNVLQAITSWGDAVSAEARALASYNAAFASLDRESGWILELHGVTLAGQNYVSEGPLAPLHDGRTYPHSAAPTPNVDRYPPGNQPADRALDLQELPRSRGTAP